MKTPGIYHRILRFLVATGSLFLVIVLILFLLNQRQEKLFVEASEELLAIEAASLLNLRSNTQSRVVHDYTYWDEFYNVANDPSDSTWYAENIETLIESFQFDYVGVLNREGAWLFESGSDEFAERGILTPAMVDTISKRRTAHFYLNTPSGVLELSAATIHPTNDPTRKNSPSHGILAVGTLWTRTYLDEAEQLTSSALTVLPPSDTIETPEKSRISVHTPLKNEAGNEVAHLLFSREYNVLRIYRKMTILMLSLLFSTLAFIAFLFQRATRRWISRPLQLVSDILKSEKMAFVRLLKRYPGEYGQIGQLFEQYIRQKAELRVAKEIALENERLKTAFLANMSHEIRTPVNGILGFADLLSDPELSEEERKEYLNIIRQSGDRLMSMINDLLNISKIEAGQVELNTMPVYLNEEFDFLQLFFQPEAETKGITLLSEKGNDDENDLFLMDKDKFHMILMNLIKNAIKYSGSREIVMGYQEKEHQLEFYVKDSGIGIPADKQSAIFDRFVQVDNSLSNPYGGAGLGLSITKGYVELMGGQIWLVSKEGEGSQFFFTLPKMSPDSRTRIT
ncbi:MAG: ATP-binding protein [Bacteroidales bacterium]